MRNPLVPARKSVVAAVMSARNWLCDCEFHERAEHVDEGDEIQDDGEREKFLECFLNAGPGKIQNHQHGGDDALHDQRRVGRGEARVNVSEPGGHVGIEAGDEGDAGAAADPGGTDAGDGEAEHDGERYGDPAYSDAASHAAGGLHDALQNVDVFPTAMSRVRVTPT